MVYFCYGAYFGICIKLSCSAVAAIHHLHIKQNLAVASGTYCLLALTFLVPSECKHACIMHVHE